MRLTHTLSVTAFLALSAMSVFSQGLTAVRDFSGDFDESQPLTWSITGRTGYDSLSYSVPSPFLQDFESYYLQGGLGVTYADADPTTPWSMAVDVGAIHYLDGIPRYDDTFYNARVAFNVAHQLSQRLKISNNFYLTYEAEPNVATGASTTLYNGQYLYGFNNFNVSYAWSQRFSTTTSVTVDGISYEDDAVSGLEDRLSVLIAQQFSYALTKRTSLAAEYRYRITDYRERDDVDATSHFVLAGVDHAWSERVSGSFRVGAEFFKSDRAENTSPYGEMALSYLVARQTTARWFGSVGYDSSELGGFDTRYAVRTGLNVNHQVTKRVGVNAGVSYAYSTFDSGGGTDVAEHSLLLSTGLSYQLLENLALDARYSYSILKSDDSLREFDRNNISLGMTASF
ncbi:putative beta-barrel porin 2 [Prosthecobacter fusiformis]|uniref:Putative beta-barrel porin 2 n=1 Tax=Prosthecobacter fusiformis TaxID=48464 RepID=A0A4R7ST54_9BACT|nr:outer membrane beta-barrel protein [Prosthecobacter fusiformis]TDU81447.1 putative beta-barrel porin 2 [Prosthecobacter fusiformis]